MELIKDVVVKPILAIQLMHVIVKCREHVFAVMIANVVVVFAKKQYPNYKPLFSFLLISYV